jgi:hypothetical protein
MLAAHNDGRALRDDQKFLFINADLRPERAFKNAEADADHGRRIKHDRRDRFTSWAAQTGSTRCRRVRRVHQRRADRQAVLAAYADPSVTNLSSIVCLASLGGHPADRRARAT